MVNLVVGQPFGFDTDYLASDRLFQVSLPRISAAIGAVLKPPADSTGDIVLYERGCQVPNAPGLYPRTVFNCTAACADPATALADSLTIWNCATLVSVELLVRDNALDLDHSAAAYSSMLGFNATAAAGHLLSCAADGCEHRDGVTCSSELVRQLQSANAALRTNDSHLAVQSLDNVFVHYCDGATLGPAGLVAGPGVLVAFLIQLLLALFLFTGLKFFTSWTRLLAFPILTLRRRPQLPDTTPWAAATGLQTSLTRSRAATALFATAVDFHDLQLWLVLAAQSAALLHNTHRLPTPLSHTTTLLNADLTTALAINACLPVLLTELALRRARAPGPPSAHSWCTTLLTTAVWLLSGAVLATAADNRMRAAYDPQPDPLSLARARPACGGRAALAVYCGLERGPGLAGLAPAFYALGVGYPVVPYLWVAQVAAALGARGLGEGEVRRRGRYGVGVAGVLGRRARAGGRGCGVVRRVWIGVCEVVDALFQGGVLVFMLLNLVVLVRLVKFVDMDAEQWNYAQVMVMAVWIPTVVRWLYMNLFGIEKSFRARRLGDYEVVRKEPKEQKEEPLQVGEDAPFIDPDAHDDFKRPSELVTVEPYRDEPQEHVASPS